MRQPTERISLVARRCFDDTLPEMIDRASRLLLLRLEAHASPR
jgi:hypothetical protein